MKPKERVLLSILVLAKDRRKLTQKEIAEVSGCSISTVNSVVNNLEGIGAVRRVLRGFFVQDYEKTLLLFSSYRTLEKDIVYSTFCSSSPERIEASMPFNVLFTAYSGYKILFGEPLADYGEVYVYSQDPGEVKERFPPAKGPPNIFVLRWDKILAAYHQGNCVPIPLLFADIWSLPHWYSKEYIKGLRERIL